MMSLQLLFGTPPWSNDFPETSLFVATGFEAIRMKSDVLDQILVSQGIPSLQHHIQPIPLFISHAMSQSHPNKKHSPLYASLYCSLSKFLQSMVMIFAWCQIYLLQMRLSDRWFFWYLSNHGGLWLRHISVSLELLVWTGFELIEVFPDELLPRLQYRDYCISSAPEVLTLIDSFFPF